MTRMWIVVGDATSSGGRVITGSHATDIDGKPVSRVGDKATCPLHKGVFPIADGDPTTIIDGQPVALHGSKLACGCTVLAVRQSHVFLDSGGAGSGPDGTAQALAASAVPATRGAAQYDEAFILKSVEGRLLAGRRYRIIRESGAVEEGTTDAAGRTHLVNTGRPETLKIEIGEEGP